MKIIRFRQIIAYLLCFVIALSAIANAAYKDDFSGSYSELGCAEDDCDCLEPENNRFQVVSPSSQNNLYNTVVLTGTFEEVQAYYKSLGQTDSMPVIPPTVLKVEKFMRYTPYLDNDIIATVNGRSITAYQVAVNAVMSGCMAEYMPVCIAFVKALGNGGYIDSLKKGNLTPMAYVSGPIARQLGIDNTQGMTSEEVNIALGRFIELALINLVGITEERKSAFGYVQPLVFSENEQAGIESGWNPHHVEKGYNLNDSTVTVSSFSMWGNNLTPATDLPEEVMKVLAWDITEKHLGALGGADSNTYKDTRRTVFITESVAKVLAARYKTKGNLEDALIENARQPLWMRANAYYYADSDGAASKPFFQVYEELKVSEKAQFTQTADWMNGFSYADIETVAVMQKGNTDIIVTGDSSRNKTQVMPGGEAITVKIELPDVWDSLLTSMNYNKLSDFYLSDKGNAIIPPDKIKADITDGTYRILEPSAGETYLTGEGKLYFDSSAKELHYWAFGLGEKASVTLNDESDASFVAYLENLSPNSSFTVADGKIKEITVRFSSNAKKTDREISSLTAKSFAGIKLSLHASSAQRSPAAGGTAADGSTVTMSDSVTTFQLSLDGNLVLGEATEKGFIKLSGNTVTINPQSSKGATAIVGSKNTDNTYKTVTFYNTGDGTYKLTYNKAGTLSCKNSGYYLIIAGGEKKESCAFLKTDNPDILCMKKEIPAGVYKLKLYKAGSEEKLGSTGTFADTIQREKVDSTEAISFKASGGEYEFRFEISSDKLSVYPALKRNQAENENILSFDDVKKSDWYYESVGFVKKKGLMSGVSERKFDPDSFLTRAMLVTILYRMEGKPNCTASSFADVESGIWYSNAVSWAAENKIVSGTGNNKFAPDTSITREQIALILFNYSKLKSFDVRKTKSINTFKDSKDVSEWAKEALEWAVSSELLRGKNNGEIAPKANATRAEIATVLKRFEEKYAAISEK